MDFRIFTEPQQGASYDDLLAVAQASEELGFDALFRSDHYLVMGDGDGWFKKEHLAYAIPFPMKRFGMLEEQLEIVTGLWGTPVAETYNSTGKHYTVVESPALPKPVQSRVPASVGGGGRRKRPPSPSSRMADSPVPRPKWSTRSACLPNSGSPGSTSRFSTYTTSITWTSRRGK